MAEPDERDYEVKRLEEQLRLERGTIDYLEALVEGLQYELHMREDIRGSLTNAIRLT